MQLAFCFFKQQTAYELRISDWSSDVCSSDLGVAAFLWPFAATIAATLIIGAFFIAAGIVSIGAGIFGGIREGRGYAIAFGAVSLIIGAIMAFEPMTGALALTLLVVFWLGLRGLLALAWAIRSPAHRGWMNPLGLLHLLLARPEARRVGK